MGPDEAAELMRHLLREALILGAPVLVAACVTRDVYKRQPRSRIETRSRSSCCRTRSTSPRVRIFGTSSSTSLGWLSFSESSSRLVSPRPSSSCACFRISSARCVPTTVP